MSPKRRHTLRWGIHRHQGGKCCYCGVKLIMPPKKAMRFTNGMQFNKRAATLEHLRRKADGGTNHPDNLALACRLCNSRRGDMSWVEFKTRQEG